MMKDDEDLQHVDTATEKSLRALDAIVEEMRAASMSSIVSSESLARTARAARPSRSNPSMPAVRPRMIADDVYEIDRGELTGRFDALKKAL